MDNIPHNSTERDILRYLIHVLVDMMQGLVDMMQFQVDLGSRMGSSPSLLAHLVKYSSEHDWPVHISVGITILGQG